MVVLDDAGSEPVWSDGTVQEWCGSCDLGRAPADKQVWSNSCSVVWSRPHSSQQSPTLPTAGINLAVKVNLLFRRIKYLLCI